MEEEHELTTASSETPRQTCQRFAQRHKVIFEDEGECGLGRECVGFITRWGTYLEHNPLDASKDYHPREELRCPEAVPACVPDAYHKYDCFAVLGRGDGAVAQLAAWVRQLEAAGAVRVVDYETGNEGLAALLNGVWAATIMVTK